MPLICLQLNVFPQEGNALFYYVFILFELFWLLSGCSRIEMSEKHLIKFPETNQICKKKKRTYKERNLKDNI